MKIDELADMIEADSIIDQTDLNTASVQIPYIHAKYYRIFVNEVKILRGIEIEMKVMKRERSDYYLGKADDDVYKAEPLNHKVLKADLDLYLDADPKMIVLETRRQTQKIKTDMLEAFLKLLNNRSYQINNAITFLKFKNGIS